MINMWDQKNPMAIGFQMGQIRWDFISQCEIWHVWTSHILDGVLLVSYFLHWQKKIIFCTIVTSCSLFGSIIMIFSYIKKIQMGSFAFMFSVLLHFLKIKFLVKTVQRHLWSCFIHNQYNQRQSYCWICTFTAFIQTQLVNSLKQVTNNTLMKINTCTKLVVHPFTDNYTVIYLAVGLLYKINFRREGWGETHNFYYPVKLSITLVKPGFSQ